mmetsp:Transcript_91461/g.244902  ORF Transcript_91461/g.244902 Transcript_91461/m.244902 type:complete len:242 (-) Transcript_91461:52-777(-)
MQTTAVVDRPNFRCVVEGPCQNQVSPRGETDGHGLSGVPTELLQARPGRHVPDPCSVVHATSCNVGPLRVESHAHNLGGVADEGAEALPGLHIPELGRLVERPSDNLVAVGVVESNGINHILVPFEHNCLLPLDGIPHSARSIVGPCDEQAPSLVERASGEREHVGPQNLVGRKLLALLVLKLLNEPVNQLSQHGLPGFADEGLLESNLGYQHLNIRLLAEVEQIHSLGLDLAIAALVLED